MDWQLMAPAERREVKQGSRFADVRVGSYAIEFQHRPLGLADVRGREAAHGNEVIWIVDAREAYVWFAGEAGPLKVDPAEGTKRTDSYTWYRGSRWWTEVKGAVAFDLGEGKFLAVRKVWVKSWGLAGWGHLIESERFMESIRTNAEPPHEMTFRIEVER
jgi:hypothetical protein